MTVPRIVRRHRRLPALLAVLLAVAGCGEGRVYDVPIAEAHERLRAAEVTSVLLGGSIARSELASESSDELVWTISDEAAPVMRATARLSAEGADRTRVVATVEGATPKAVQVFAERPAMVRLQTAALEETVAAAIEKRPFNPMNAYSEIGAAVIAETPRLLEDADRHAKASAKREHENVERAYAQEGAANR